MEAANIFSMAASAGLAACTAEVLTLPIDTAKVRMQVASARPGVSAAPGGGGVAASVASVGNAQYARGGFVPVLYRMLRDEGITSWWKGLPAGLHRQFIYASLRISMYPHIRDNLNQSVQKLPFKVPDLGVQILAGMTSGALGMTVANPTDVVKVRLQSEITALRQANRVSTTKSGRTVYRGAMHAYLTIMKEEGVLGLWRGLGPNIVRNAIVCAAELVAYDELKKVARRYMPDGLPCHCFAGFGAGFIATIVGSPVDVVKTRYMNSRPGEYRNLTQCIVTLSKEAGVHGFYKGFVPNVVRLGLFNMLVFVFYEKILHRATRVASKQ